MSVIPTVSADGVGAIAAGQLNAYQISCYNTGILRTVVGQTGMSVILQGTNIPNDGGQGNFYWDYTSTATDNNFTVIRPYGVIYGAWIRTVVSGSVIGDVSNATATPTGTTTARTIANLFGDYISVKDYGAKGDGVTDDTAAIQNAINTLDYGNCLYFPTGVYIVTSTLLVTPKASTVTGLLFRGNGKGSVIQAGANMDSIMYVTGGETDFSELNFYASTYAVSKGINIQTSAADFSSFIDRCYFYFFTYGIYAKGQNYGITRSWFQNNTFAVNFADDGRNSFLSENYVLGGNTGFSFNKLTTQVEGTRITNNTILCTGGNGSGIFITDGLEINIGFNVIDQSGTNTNGIVLANSGGTVSSIKIFNNWLNAGAGGYCLFSAGNNTFLEISTNTFVGSNCTGLSLTNSNQINVFYNRFLMTTPVAELSTVGVVNANYGYNIYSNGNQGTNNFYGFTTVESLGVGTNPNSVSAILQVTSTTKGVGFPTMTTTQKNAITSPIAGLVVFDTTLGALCIYTGSAWKTITAT
jgi:hypothetical protein